MDSIEDRTFKIEKAGGNIVVPKTEIPDIGWLVVFKDPDGTLMALYKVMR